MSSNIAALIDALTQKMSYLAQKQGVLAENVANADTPGYKQLDLKPFTFKDALAQTGVGMTVTDPRHIVPAGMAGINARTMPSKDAEVQQNGNSVDLESQMMEVAKTTADYQKATSTYHKWIGLFKIAIKGSAT